MEILVEQPTRERLKSFDSLASVDMLRFDLERFGQVLPETRQRVCDEELSYITEGIDRAARTTFVLGRIDDELVIFDRGKWRPYVGMLLTGLEVAKHEASLDPRRQFLADWAASDLQYGYHMGRLKPGQELVWDSRYPHREAQMYGEEFMRSCGLKPDRKMGFLYRAVCQNDGSIVLESQTVDRSDEDAFDAALRAADKPENDMDASVGAYDSVLAEKHSGPFYAGRRETEIHENIWQTILAQRDLIDYFLDRLEVIASTPMPRDQLEDIAKRHVYGVWAALKKRIDAGRISIQVSQQGNVAQASYHVPEQEVRRAFQEFAAQGRVLVGCGGAISMLRGELDILAASGEDVFSAIFGTKTDKDNYGSLQFKCPKKGCLNTRKPGKLIKECQKCGADVTCNK